MKQPRKHSDTHKYIYREEYADVCKYCKVGSQSKHPVVAQIRIDKSKYNTLFIHTRTNEPTYPIQKNLKKEAGEALPRSPLPLE